MRIGNTWGSVRGLLRDQFSFVEIKDLVGAAGLQVYKLSQVQQMYKGGSTKGQLMDSIDGLVMSLDNDNQDRFVIACIEEIVERKKEIRSDLDKIMNRVGWSVSPTGVYPLRLQIDLETINLTDATRDGLAKCIQRYRDGDFDGSMTSICGVIDSLTEKLYEKYSLGDHRNDSYQQRIVNSFSALEIYFKLPLELSGLEPEKINRIWHNHKGAVNQSGYLLGAFRREFADVHGVNNSQPEIVQRALDCAVFLIRSFSSSTPPEPN